MFNSRTLVMEQSIHVKLNEGLTTNRKLSYLKDDFIDIHIGPSISPKTDEVKQFDEILPQTKESSS